MLMVKLEGSGCKSSLDTGVMVVGGLVTACGDFTGAESGRVAWLGVSIGGLCEPTHGVCLWPCLCTRPFLWCSFHSKKQTPQVPLAFWGRLEEVGVTNGVDCMLRRLRVAENFRQKSHHCRRGASSGALSCVGVYMIKMLRCRL